MGIWRFEYSEVPRPHHLGYLGDARRTSVFSRKRYSIPVPRKVSIASRGVFTMGWPFTLKLVFRTISRPVILPPAFRSSWNSPLSFGEAVSRGADPFACVMAGSAARY